MVQTDGMNQSPPAPQFQFVGGELCLDFCNTMGGKRENIPREKLHQYGDLLAWSEQAGLVDRRLAGIMSRKGAKRPGEAASVLRRAIALREAVYRICMAMAQHKKAQPADLLCLNSELAAALGRLRVVCGKDGDGFMWEWANDEQSLDYPLGPIARSAADLLMRSDVVKRVCQCHGDNCGWLFLDSSKNHSRCWCDMRDCGNRAKIRRFRLKKRS